MGAVVYDVTLVGVVHLQKSRRIEDAGIPFQLSRFVQHERIFIRLFLLGDQPELPFDLQDVHLDAVVAIAQAVRQIGDILQLGRQAAQGLDQAGIALDLDVQLAGDLVVRQAVGIEILVFLGHGFQGIGQVEGVLLLLRIEHERQLVALLHDGDHPLVLLTVLFGQPRLGGEDLVIVRLQFVPECVQGRRQVAFAQHRRERQGQQEGGRQGHDPFLFHPFCMYESVFPFNNQQI